MTKLIRTAAFIAVVFLCVSCGDVVRDSRAPVVLTVTSLQGAPTGGFGANTFVNVLDSDVLVMATSPAPCSVTSPCPSIFADNGRATISSTMKNLGVSPTANNQVTLSRYHVEFRRADGRNVEGLDVPRSFDGAVTAAIPAGGSAAVPFELVRHAAKQESPLAQLSGSSAYIATIATVTFYGTDTVGNVVSTSGQMSINFGNFGDR